MWSSPSQRLPSRHARRPDNLTRRCKAVRDLGLAKSEEGTDIYLLHQRSRSNGIVGPQTAPLPIDTLQFLIFLNLCFCCDLCA
jgi:hypothetical protein